MDFYAHHRRRSLKGFPKQLAGGVAADAHPSGDGFNLSAAFPRHKVPVDGNETLTSSPPSVVAMGKPLRMKWQGGDIAIQETQQLAGTIFVGDQSVEEQPTCPLRPINRQQSGGFPFAPRQDNDGLVRPHHRLQDRQRHGVHLAQPSGRSAGR
jgi:hypothetical protein